MSRTLVIIATLINVGCATILACRGEIGDYIPVYGFDLVRSQLYLGKKEDPKDTVPLSDPELEKQWIAMRLESWQAVKDRLATCH